MRTGDGILLDGQLVGLRKGGRTLVLRTAQGVVVKGCEDLVDAIVNGKPFILQPGTVPDEIIAAAKQVVLSADEFCNGDRPVTDGVVREDRS